MQAGAQSLCTPDAGCTFQTSLDSLRYLVMKLGIVPFWSAQKSFQKNFYFCQKSHSTEFCS